MVEKNQRILQNAQIKKYHIFELTKNKLIRFQLFWAYLICLFQLILLWTKRIFYNSWRVQSLQFDFFSQLTQAKTVWIYFSQAQKSDTFWFWHFARFLCSKHGVACKLKLPIEEDKKHEKAFVLAHFTRQKMFFKKNKAQNQRAKLIFSKWVGRLNLKKS